MIPDSAVKAIVREIKTEITTPVALEIAQGAGSVVQQLDTLSEQLDGVTDQVVGELRRIAGAVERIAVAQEKMLSIAATVTDET